MRISAHAQIIDAHSSLRSNNRRINAKFMFLLTFKTMLLAQCLPFYVIIGNLINFPQEAAPLKETKSESKF